MIWRVTHSTVYAYAEPVDMATHMLHLWPRALPWQQVCHASLGCTPEPARITRRADHFGNLATWLFLDRPHRRFEVTAEAVIAVDVPPPPGSDATLPWEAVAAAAPGVAEAAEFLFDSPMLRAEPGARGYAAQCFPPGRPVLAGLRELTARIRRDFAYRPGVTAIATPLSQVLAQRAGVCQDFTHLMIAGLRGLGLPARYVSGYIRTRPPPGGTARRGADQSHAWVGAWLGPVHGWVDLDPTNDLVVRDEHAVLAWGRDFSDVSPLRGVILGGGRHTVTVEVDLAPAG